ncbi:peroxisome assembly factor 2-like [Asterias rubens]|uniref:peroxisome assembly factor 2-like n=1 Tax=Asterias rubens TaxID=7604 RepID=UPI00145571C0|nr:peroxisome assembly factor 2-like [Asterias rubens]
MADLGNKPDRIHAKFSRFNFTIDHNPLHVGISKSASNLLLGDKLDSYVIASLLQSDQSYESGRETELFVCLHILNDDLVRRSISLCQVSESPGKLTLYVTERFHEHYGIADSEDVFIRPVKAFPLTKVVFGARSSRCYDWAKNRLFSTGLLVSVCQQKVLVRTSDQFLAPVIPVFSSDEAYSLANYQDLIALECEPIKQGIISINTSIVITQIDENRQFSSVIQNKHENGPESGTFRDDVVSLLPEPFLLSEFASKLNNLSLKSLLQTETVSVPKIVNLLSTEEEPPPNTLYLEPVIIPTISTHTRSTVNYLTCSENQCEVELRVGVTKSTLKRLCAFNGSWVVVSIPREEVPERENGPEKAAQSEPETSSGRDDRKPSADQPLEAKPQNLSTHLAQVFAIDQKLFALLKNSANGSSDADAANLKEGRNEEEELPPDDNVLYLSPRLWFNLQLHPSRLIQLNTVVSVRLAKTELQPRDSILASSKSISTSCQPPLAAEVHLGLIKSPDYPMTSKLDKAIKKFFSETRIVSLGDVVTLSTKEFPEYIQDISEGSHTRSPFVYFKVMKIESVVDGAVAYSVDPLQSLVFQGVPVSSYIPVTMDAYINSKLDPIWSAPLPAGVWKYTDQIEDLIVPYLIPKSQCARLTPSMLLSGPIGCGKVTVIRAVCRRLNLHCVVANCNDLCADTTASTEAKIKNIMFKGGMCAPCILVLRNIQVLARDRDGTGEDFRVSASLKEAIQSLSSTIHDYPVIVIATTPSTKAVLTDLHACFLHHLEIKVPNEEERKELLQALCETVPMATDVDIAYIAKRTAGLVLGDLCALLSHTVRSSVARVISSCSIGSKLSIIEEKDLCAAGIQVNNVDFEGALNQLQAAHADAIGAPKIPSVSWEDVGGLADVRSEILDTIQLPLQHPELFTAGLRRSGVLLYGPPGTGKTLLAKAVATECSLNFLSVKGPELINMYVGQSEENVREVFVRARSASPCVIFFDELDSLAPNRGQSGDSGGVMDRVVSQLLAELDGLHKSTDVFVIGATNRPDLLDPALLRPGRFDKMLYLGVSRDRQGQVNIIQALTRKFVLSPDVKLDLVADKCPLTMTGADFYALCSDAMLNAVKRKISDLETGNTEDELSIVVDQEDFMVALESLVPSVSEQELQHYQQIQNQISRGF